MNLGGWFKANHHTVVPYVAAVVLGYYLYHAGKTQGQVEEQFKAANARIASLEQQVSEAKTLLAQKDSAVATAEQNRNRIQIVPVDRNTKPVVDAALANLRTQLDSAQQAQLKVVVDGYEARIAIRESRLAADSVLIGELRAVRIQADQVIARQDSTITELKTDLKAAQKRPGLVTRVAKAAVPVATLLVLLVKR